MGFSTSALTLYPYQKRWIQDQSRFKIGMFARQTGKTFSTTLELVDSCFAAESEGRRERWVILSRGERQAREAMEEGVKRHAAAYNLAIETLEYSYQGSEGNYKALEVVLPGGSRITALPANPDTARGFSANVMLDEFAFHQDSRKIWAALFPVISAGHKLRIVSTPNGKGNKFYELMTAEDPVWSKHTCDIHQAVADGLPRDIPELKAALNDQDAWQTEYLLHWLDSASAWLDYDLINSCEHEAAGDPNHYQGGACYVGVDIGIRRDLWVAWVVESVGDVLWTREIRTVRRGTFAEQDRILDELLQRYRVLRVCIDQTGMGEKVVEDAQRRHGTSRVEGVLFTQASKLHLATLGKQRFEDRRVRIPLGDPELRADLHKLQKQTTPTGGARFVADSDAAGHADRTWACFLACHAAEAGGSAIEFQTLPRRTDYGDWLGTGGGGGRGFRRAQPTLRDDDFMRGM